MCTAVLSVRPGLPVLLAGVRDELTDREWEPPGQHWPRYPGLVGGRDLVAGGTWLAVSPHERRVACVLNGRGQLAPTASRLSRGVLPLRAAASGAARSAARADLPLADLPLANLPLADLDPFHLLTAEPGQAVMQTWDGHQLTERELGSGLHFVVNSGLASDLLASDLPGGPAFPATQEGREQELARIAHFVKRFEAAPRPEPQPGQPVSQAWGAWFPLLNGDGIGPDDPRALIVRRDLGDGRTWGTTSISLIALWPARAAENAPEQSALRYDFTSAPGDPAAWYPVSPSTWRRPATL